MKKNPFAPHIVPNGKNFLKPIVFGAKENVCPLFFARGVFFKTISQSFLEKNPSNRLLKIKSKKPWNFNLAPFISLQKNLPLKLVSKEIFVYAHPKVKNIKKTRRGPPTNPIKSHCIFLKERE